MDCTTSEYSVVLRLSDLSIDVIWDAETAESMDPGYTYVHSHPFYEVLISVKGVSLTLFHGNSVILPPGTLCLIPPGIYHSTQEMSSGKSKRALRFIYERSEVSDSEEALYTVFHSMLSACTEPVILSDPKVYAIYELLAACSAEISDEAPFAKTNTQLRLGTVFIDILRMLCSKNELADNEEGFGQRNSRRMQIEVWMQGHFTDNITEQDLADYMNLSQRQTSRCLNDIYHCGFRELLIDLRMHAAAEKLAMTELPVDGIAYAVGYTSLSGFYSTFHRIWGMSAIQYRRKFTNNS